VILNIPQEIDDNYQKCVLNRIEAEKCRVLSDAKDNTIVIRTPLIINIQDFFDEWFQKGAKNETMLFRSLRCLKDDHYHAKKVLRTWNVKIGPVHFNTDTKEDRDAVRDATPIDEGGGPTRAFVSAFCVKLVILSLEFPLVEIRIRMDRGLILVTTLLAQGFQEEMSKALLSRDHPRHRRTLSTLKDPVLTTQGLQREDFTLEEDSISLFDCRPCSSKK
jgi:hypothetical protein